MGDPDREPAVLLLVMRVEEESGRPRGVREQERLTVMTGHGSTGRLEDPLMHTGGLVHDQEHVALVLVDPLQGLWVLRACGTGLEVHCLGLRLQRHAHGLHLQQRGDEVRELFDPFHDLRHHRPFDLAPGGGRGHRTQRVPEQKAVDDAPGRYGGLPGTVAGGNADPTGALSELEESVKLPLVQRGVLALVVLGQVRQHLLPDEQDDAHPSLVGAIPFDKRYEWVVSH